MSVGQPSNDSERLPWLEPYRDPAVRPAKPTAPRPGKAPIKRSPMLALLIGGILLVGLVGFGSYWLGRNSAPVGTATELPRGPSVTIPVASVEPIPMPEVAAPAPVEAAPEPVRKAVSPTRSTKRVVRHSPARAIVKRPVAKTVVVAPPPPPPPPPPKPRVAVRMSAPPLVAPAGQVVDLGSFITPRHADAAYRALVGRYPYLRQLSKVVAPYGGTYRLELGARSRRDARALCRNIAKLGRPCAVR